MQKTNKSILTANEFSWVYNLKTDQKLTPNPSDIEIGRCFSKENLDIYININRNKVVGLFIHIWKKYCNL
jgi:hypothetical protein